MVGLFVQLESPPFPGAEERTKQANASSKHLTASVDATYMAPYLTMGPEHPFPLRSVHL